MKNELNRTDKERYHEKDIELPSSKRVSIVFAISSFILVSVASYTIGNSIRLYQFSQKSLKKKPQQISSETSQFKHDIGSTCQPTDAEHLLIDVINVRDKELLVDHNSFLRNLVTSPILEFTQILGHHCYTMEHDGYHCIIHLRRRGHIAVHTSTKSGVVHMDFFQSCGFGTGSPPEVTEMINSIKKHMFGVGAAFNPPPFSDTHNIDPDIDNYFNHVRWSHKLRGFGKKLVDIVNGETNENPLHTDLANIVLDGWYLQDKEQVASVHSLFQQIDVFDLLDTRKTTLSSYRKSLSLDDNIYEAQHAELFRPNRVIFLDGVMQSTRLGNEGYHESLVQPAMFAHSNPRRVAIIGGGEGATLREVLKHDTVENVVMIEIDEIMVDICKEHLLDWNSCADIEGSVNGTCFDDERADTYYEDAVSWFVDRFSDEQTCASTDEDCPAVPNTIENGDDEDDDDDDDENVNSERDEINDDDETSKAENTHRKNKQLYGTEEPFDVIIMDALDPEDNVDFADVLYNDVTFIRSLFDALTDDGILVMQLGESYSVEDLPPEILEANRLRAIRSMEKLGFHSMHPYDDAHCGFWENPWSFLVACKSSKCSENWYASSAQVELSIRKRLRKSLSGENLMKYFDGSTMAFFQVPRVAFEVIDCRRLNSRLPECEVTNKGYDFKRSHFSSSNFKIVPPTNHGDSYAIVPTVDIPKMSYIDVGGKVSMGITQHTISSLRTSHAQNPDGKTNSSSFATIVDKVIGGDTFMTNKAQFSAISAVTVIDNGCVGRETINIDSLGNWVENQLHGKSEVASFKNRLYNPTRDRHTAMFDSDSLFISLRDISKGEKICFKA